MFQENVNMLCFLSWCSINFAYAFVEEKSESRKRKKKTQICWWSDHNDQEKEIETVKRMGQNKENEFSVHNVILRIIHTFIGKPRIKPNNVWRKRITRLFTWMRFLLYINYTKYTLFGCCYFAFSLFYFHNHNKNRVLEAQSVARCEVLFSIAKWRGNGSNRGRSLPTMDN